MWRRFRAPRRNQIGPAAAAGPKPLPAGETVADYYEAFTDVYLRATGDFIQAFRTSDTEGLMTYLAASSGLRDGMRILDAGCGVGAPAIWIARRFPSSKISCLTNSRRQFELASERVAASGLGDRITVLTGDYHELDALYPAASFDRVLFLESLGHHQGLTRVIDGAAAVLASGGAIFIKDFFRRTSRVHAVKAEIDAAIATINRNYVYNVMDLSELIDTLRQSNFTLAYARQPDLVPDLGLTIAFEHEAERLTYPSFASVHAVDWMELHAVRN
jgi:ubiquinone/menaquinone biosynthesis C-methylase UbiE